MDLVLLLTDWMGRCRSFWNNAFRRRPSESPCSHALWIEHSSLSNTSNGLLRKEKQTQRKLFYPFKTCKLASTYISNLIFHYFLNKPSGWIQLAESLFQNSIFLALCFVPAISFPKRSESTVVIFFELAYQKTLSLSPPNLKGWSMYMIFNGLNRNVFISSCDWCCPRLWELVRNRLPPTTNQISAFRLLVLKRKAHHTLHRPWALIHLLAHVSALWVNWQWCCSYQQINF